MVLMAQKLAKYGLDGGIMAEHVHPEMTGQVRRLDASELRSDDILLLHHSLHNGRLDEILAAPCRKVLVYHNITKPRFFPPGSLLRKAAIGGYQQLWKIKEAVAGSICDSDFNRRALDVRGFANTQTICLLSDFTSLPSLRSNGAPWHHEEDVFHILFVGRICPNKGQHHLVRALPDLARALGRRVRLTLCGHADHGGGYMSRLTRMIARLGLENDVRMPGSVSNEDLYGYYREADAYVSYSQHEGFGVPLIEAMAFGTPVFAYGATAVPEVMGGAGRVLHTLEPDELATAIREVFATRSSLREMVQRQRQRVFELSIDRTFPDLIAFLNRTFDLRLPAPEAPPPPQEASRQVLFEGPLGGSYSLSQVNRGLALALHRQEGNLVSAVPREGTDNYRYDPAGQDPEMPEILSADLDISLPMVGIRNMYPPRVRGHVADMRLHFLYWEESRLPVWLVRQINSQLDGLLAPSSYCAKVYRDSGVTVPICTVGSGLVNPHIRPRAAPRGQGGGPFTFLHISSGLVRKGIVELLQAWARAFTAQDDVVLLIKTYRNPSNVIPDLVAEILGELPDAPLVIVTYDEMSDAQIAKLYTMADAVVLPTRGEGFNLPAAEALKAGVPLLVTDTGAHLDFCGPQNAVLLKSDFEWSQSHLAEKGSYWARVDVADLAGKMRDLVSGGLQAPTPELVYDAEDWSVVAKRLMSFVAKLAAPKPLKDKIRLASISTYNTKCGIAAYSQTLTEQIAAGGLFEIQHWASRETPQLEYAETAAVLRLWTPLGGQFLEMCRKAVDETFDAVLVQFNFGFFTLEDFFAGLDHLSAQGVASYVVFHKTADADVGGKRVSLADHVAGLRKISRIFVHDVEDVAYLRSLGLSESVTLLPHFIPDMPRLSKSSMRQVLGLAEAGPIIATNGFLLPNKGVPQLIEAFAEIAGRFPRAHLLLVTALFPAGGISAEVKSVCDGLISDLGLEGRVSLITDFLTLDQIHMLLSAADVVVYPYGPSGESSSASVRQGLAARRPVIGTSSQIFANVRGAIDIFESTDPADIAERIGAILSDGKRQSVLVEQVEKFLTGQSPADIARIVMANIRQDIIERDGVEFPLLDAPSDEELGAARPSPLSSRNSDAILRGLLGDNVPAGLSKSFQSVYNSSGTVAAAVDDLLGNDEYFEKVLLSPQRLEALKQPVVNLRKLRSYEGEAFVQQCYLQLLGRAADESGLKVFTEALGEQGKDAVIKSLLSSEEYSRRVIPRRLIES